MTTGSPTASERAGNGPPDSARPGPGEALERERWLRKQIDKERELRFLVGRSLMGALTHEPSIMRFWRWLIDDLRSERREQAALLADRDDEGILPKAWAWLSSRRRPRRGNPAARERPAPSARADPEPALLKWWMRKR